MEALKIITYTDMNVWKQSLVCRVLKDRRDANTVGELGQGGQSCYCYRPQVRVEIDGKTDATGKETRIIQILLAENEKKKPS